MLKLSDERWIRFRFNIAKARKRPDRARRPNTLFNDLHRDVRVLIYGYLSFPPLHYLRPEGQNFLAFTCRQAFQETTEEGQRQLWILVRNFKRTAFGKLGLNPSLSKKLTSKDDLSGLKTLTIVISGAYVLSGLIDDLPKGHQELLSLRLDTLNFRYINNRPGPPGMAKSADFALLFAVNEFMVARRHIQTRTVTISWDYRKEKIATTLEGIQLETKHATKRVWRRGRDVGKWPTLVSAADREETVGLLSLEPGSRGETVIYGPEDLHYLVVDRIIRRSGTITNLSTVTSVLVNVLAVKPT